MFNGRRKHFLCCKDNYLLKNTPNRVLLLGFILYCTSSSSHFLYISCINSRFQKTFLKKWGSITGVQALHIIFIFIWGITLYKADNLAPQILFLAALWSHSGWSPGWADSSRKPALFNEQHRAWVQRQQVGRQINALRLGMDHLPAVSPDNNHQKKKVLAK